MCSLSLISDVFFLKDFFPDQLSLEQFFQKPVFCASVGVLASLRDVFLNNGISVVEILRGKTAEGWEKFVEKKGGPDGLVGSWLMQKVPGSGGPGRSDFMLEDYCRGGKAYHVVHSPESKIFSFFLFFLTSFDSLASVQEC